MSDNQRKCPHCQAVLEDDAIFCVECGNTTEIPEAKEEETVIVPIQTPIPKIEEVIQPIQPTNIQTENVEKESVIPIFEKFSPTNNSNVVNSLTVRYQDGYRVANTVDSFGKTLKVLGIIFGILIALFGVQIGAGLAFNTRDGAAFAFIAIILGVIIGSVLSLIFWVLGVIISAQGQMLKANFDSAVNSSPFLADEDRIKIMGL